MGLTLVTLVIAARIAARGIPVTCARKRIADAAWSKPVSSIEKTAGVNANEISSAV